MAISVNTLPLAQSFKITNEPGGGFITSVDLYFSTKPATSNEPVFLQVRPLKNGVPSDKIITGSSVKVSKASVNVNATELPTATKFTFVSPIYVPEDEEYCFTIHSNATGYGVWSAQLGMVDIATGSTISKPSTESRLFKSVSSTSWVEDTSTDLTFVVNRGVFNTTSSTIVELLPLVYAEDFYTPKSNPFTHRLSNNPFRYNITTPGGSSSTIIVSHFNHGLSVAESVTFSGSTTPGMNGTFSVASVSNIHEYTLSSSSSSDPYSFGGAVVNALTNIAYNAASVSADVAEFGSGKVNFTIIPKIDNSSSLASPIRVPPRTLVELPNTDEIVSYASVVGFAGGVFNSGTNTKVQTTFINTRSNLSPVLNLKSIGLMTYSTIVDDDEADPVSSYVTIAPKLKISADSIRVYFDGFRPQGGDFKVFYKAVNSENSERIEDVDWTEMTGSDTNPPPDSDVTKFNEYSYSVESLDAFNTFKIKVSLLSETRELTPKIKNFRAIALAE